MSSTEEILRVVREKAGLGNYRITLHAEKERHRDTIEMSEIEESLTNPEMIEEYPEDPRGRSCLLLGFTREGKPIHIVAGALIGDVPLVIITVYRPDPGKWIDWRTRR